MPDIYKPGEYDLVGFAVGVAEKSRIITGKDITAGNLIIGISSSGLHSNGFTLVRKLIEHKGLNYSQHIKDLDTPLGEVLLTPTTIYAKITKELTSRFAIKGMANITGGGWVENIPRMLTDDKLKICAFKNKTYIPEIFNLVQEWGNIDTAEMFSTFNMGVGFTLCVDSSDAEEIISAIKGMGEQAYIIGTVEPKAGGEQSIELI